MGLSSIHIKGVRPTSERHNQREQKLNYVKESLSPLNESFILRSISETRKDAEARYLKNVGQKMQAKAEPIREGVLLLEKHHTLEDLKRLGKRLEETFGIKTIQGYIHRDEGHHDKETGQWKPNLHGHLVFDWTDEKGKSIRLKRDDLSELQTIVAHELNMTRGHSSSKKHLNAIQYKANEEAKALQELKETSKKLQISFTEIDNYSVKGFIGQNHEKTIEGLKSALKAEKTKDVEIERLGKEVNKLNERLSSIKRHDDFELKILALKASNYLEQPNKQSSIEVKRCVWPVIKDKELGEKYSKEVRQHDIEEKQKAWRQSTSNEEKHQHRRKL